MHVEPESDEMLSIIAGSTQDKLHEGLEFSPAKGTANYILDRFFCVRRTDARRRTALIHLASQHAFIW